MLAGFSVQNGRAQTHQITLEWPSGQDSLRLGEGLVLPASIQLRKDSIILGPDSWQFVAESNVIVLKDGAASPPFQVSFRISSVKLTGDFYLRDTTEMNQDYRDLEVSAYDPPASSLPVFGSGIQKTGSLSRGIAFGNTQNLSVNSNLNLQLSGRITENVSILATISDNSIPIQPQGNTQQLQDFDQVYIQLFDDRQKLVAGDFQIIESRDQYLRFNKRAQGLTFSGSYPAASNAGQWKVQASAALSKGKFARNEIQGVEGNQGPYRLTGPNGEPFIIVLAGTERVFIDGQLLQRGQDADYTIDYNASEIVFTPKRPITKDRRIIVEFQFSDRNYARSMLQGGLEYSDPRKSGFIRWFAENDSRNQPLQQQLTLADREVLATAGDDPLGAVILGSDSVGWSADAVRYAKVDSLGYTGILLWTTNADSGLYQASFSQVGAGLGDYVEDGFTASGRIFRWIAPDTVNDVIIHNGEYEPVVLLARPEQRRLATFGGAYKIGNNWSIQGEGALSKLDRNTFSSLDGNDDQGQALSGAMVYDRPADSTRTWAMQARFEGEWLSRDFEEIERFREVEFWRDWNLLGAIIEGRQRIYSASWKAQSGQIHRYRIEASRMEWGSFEGNRAKAELKWKPSGGMVEYRAALLQADYLDKSLFARHKTHAFKTLGPMQLGYKDEWEWNERRQDSNLLGASYRFHDAQVYLKATDTTRVGLEAFYRVRTDRLSDTLTFVPANRAEQYGVKLDLLNNRSHQFRANVSNRILRILDDEVSTSTPESTLLGRLEHRWAPGSGSIRSELFYEVGSGLEQKREFVYIEVPAGQGIYIWNDYDEDGIKDLNEFEIAAFAYEANYIRSFVPGNDYIKTFSSAFTYNLSWNPARRPAKSDSWYERFKRRYSGQGSIRFKQKTLEEDGFERYVPGSRPVEDSLLVSTEASFRGTLFYNRTNPRFGMQGSFREVRNKVLLANGFDSRELIEAEGQIRFLIAQSWTIRTTYAQSQEASAADYTSGRDFRISGYAIRPELTWQPGTLYRLSVELRFSDRSNEEDLGGERARLTELASTFKIGSAEKGSLEGRISYIDIDFNGEGQSALTFELLEGLAAGRNATWNVNIRRNVARNLQITLRYDGRFSGNNPVVHSGGLQARAFF